MDFTEAFMIRIESGRVTGDATNPRELCGRVVRVTLAGQTRAPTARIRKVKWKHLKKNEEELNEIVIEFFAPVRFDDAGGQSITFIVVHWNWKNPGAFSAVTAVKGSHHVNLELIEASPG